jgi:hypothetical protein
MRTSSAFGRARLWLVAVGILAIAAPLAFAGPATTGRTTAYRLHLAPHAVTSAKKAPVGQVFGGKTSQGWPVVVEVSKDGKKVVSALAAVELTCTSGMSLFNPDGYSTMPLSAKGAFKAAFGPQPLGSMPPDRTVIGQGAATGARNAAGTKMKGTWTETFTVVDPAGTTVDTCTTGNLTWTAKQ